MKLLRTLALAAVMTMVVTPMALAQSSLVRKVDSFDFLVDYSGSMMMKSTTLGAPKIDLAKDVLDKVNAAIPNLGYLGSLHTFASPSTVLPLAPWNPSTMAQAIGSLRNDLPIYGRLTPMGEGFLALQGEFAQMKRPAAIIVTSDGEQNLGIDPVAEAAAIYQSQPGVCFHVISLADKAEGKAVLQRIAALNSCSVMVEAGDLLANQAAVDKFVADVFYTSGMEEAIVLRGVNFAFDSSALDAKAVSILNEVVTILRAQPNTRIILEGWTDWIGTDEYNMGLSQRRANSVRDYLVRQGIPASNITAIGKGKSYKYDNRTDEGRYLNRRTELIFN